jgi:ribonuclease T
MPRIADRFRGFLPVVVDVETGGFNARTDALLEIAASIIRMDDFGRLFIAETLCEHVEPFPGSNIDPKSLEITGIRLDSPLRGALPEKEALRRIFQPIRKEMRDTGCQRAILVGHNSFFDLSFVNAAIERTDFKRSPFHPFSSFDTVTLGGLALARRYCHGRCSLPGWSGMNPKHIQRCMILNAQQPCSAASSTAGKYSPDSEQLPVFLKHHFLNLTIRE